MYPLGWELKQGVRQMYIDSIPFYRSEMLCVSKNAFAKFSIPIVGHACFLCLWRVHEITLSFGTP